MMEYNVETVVMLNEKLKATEEKLKNVMNLVYKTFTGDSSAAKELSEIVGVPAPILCSEDVESSPRIKKATQNNETNGYSESNSRLASRMDFLNQVMSDHDKMMKPNYPKPTTNKIPMTGTYNLRNRARSADRAGRGIDHIYFNPHAWNLNEHTEISPSYLYKTELSNSPNFCHAKPLMCKSAKFRPQTRQANSSEIKVEHILHNSENRLSVNCNANAMSDYKLTYDGELNVDKPPKPMRPMSSTSQKRNSSARMKRKSNLQTPFHNLNLQPMDDNIDNTEKLLDAMEKRFQLSTIDLQRRLGIPESGMVGP